MIEKKEALTTRYPLNSPEEKKKGNEKKLQSEYKPIASTGETPSAGAAFNKKKVLPGVCVIV